MVDVNMSILHIWLQKITSCLHSWQAEFLSILRASSSSSFTEWNKIHAIIITTTPGNIFQDNKIQNDYGTFPRKDNTPRISRPLARFPPSPKCFPEIIFKPYDRAVWFSFRAIFSCTFWSNIFQLIFQQKKNENFFTSNFHISILFVIYFCLLRLL